MNSRFTQPLFLVFSICLFTIACTAQPAADSDPLRMMREMTRSGQMPAESVVENIERRYSGTRTGALAKLLRGRIRFENKNYAGAADVLNSDEFERLTDLGDYAIWLRGQALQLSGNHAAAMQQFERVATSFPTSLRVREAKIRWAESAIASGRAAAVPTHLSDLVQKHDPEALLLTAKAFETAGDQMQAIAHFRKAFLFGGGSDHGKQAEARLKELLVDPMATATADELTVSAGRQLSRGQATLAYDQYTELIRRFPSAATPEVHLRRISAAARQSNGVKAQAAFEAMPANMPGMDRAYHDLVTAYAKSKLWPRARAVAEEMHVKYPQRPLTVKAWVDAGYAARDARNKGEENYFLRAALVNYPTAVEVAGAQFELAWLEHEAKNHAKASEMLIEHLGRYADKDTTNRGRAGYWSARNSELAGKTAEACALYDATAYRYSANWYGYIALERLGALRKRGQCQSAPAFPAGSIVSRAAANLKTITVAPETSGPRELERAEKSDQLSTIGLFDWAIEELKDAQSTAQNSPKINLALAKHYKLKGDNVNALLALAKSYPDYAQMFPEEMGREEWDIFYPHMAWDEIRKWSRARGLDIYKVAGLIRQESVFNPTAASSAKAYGLMQLLVPTAQMMARKYGSAPVRSSSDLYNPALNIELGTAYMKDQLDKYGRIEYMAVAYNAGPGRVVTWRRTLPMEMDEFVEAIPFRETKGYVQGIIRNTAQYRRLYDENGNFKPNVGTKPVRSAIDTKAREQFTAEFPEVVVANGRSSE